MAGSCERGNEFSGSIKCCKFLNYLRKYQLSGCHSVVLPIFNEYTIKHLVTQVCIFM